MTRVGEGPVPAKMDPWQNWTVQEKGKELSVTTRRPRRCGWFDGVVLHYARRVNGLDELAITRRALWTDLTGSARCGSGFATGRTATPEEFPGEFGALARCEPEVPDSAGLEPADCGRHPARGPSAGCGFCGAALQAAPALRVDQRRAVSTASRRSMPV